MPEGYSEELKLILKDMLHPEPNRRKSAKELLLSEYFKVPFTKPIPNLNNSKSTNNSEISFKHSINIGELSECNELLHQQLEESNLDYLTKLDIFFRIITVNLFLMNSIDCFENIEKIKIEIAEYEKSEFSLPLNASSIAIIKFHFKIFIRIFESEIIFHPSTNLESYKLIVDQRYHQIINKFKISLTNYETFLYTQSKTIYYLKIGNYEEALEECKFCEDLIKNFPLEFSNLFLELGRFYYYYGILMSKLNNSFAENCFEKSNTFYSNLTSSELFLIGLLKLHYGNYFFAIDRKFSMKMAKENF